MSEDNHYGLDGAPMYPRPGHFDHVTGHRLPTSHGKPANSVRAANVVLLVLMIVVGLGLAFAHNLIG
ncbi:MAG: hypothetical protein B7Z20_12970 [Sphingobium sp. 32-64-5]|nr:MAG: hypothetical protein B7Z20_12970 [Sphingobium sp. 32-64-5]